MFPASFGEQLGYSMNSFPTFLAAAVAKALDRLQYRLRFVANKVIINVNH